MTDTVRCGVIAPSYNNRDTVFEVLNELSAAAIDVIVVDDGSTDGAAAEIERWQLGGADRDDPQRVMVSHLLNQGKAAALRTGFARARALGWTHAVTIDTDGQLDPADVPALVQAVRDHPQRIICGVRDHAAAGMLGRSRLGRALSNRLVGWSSGVHTADSQCGFRAYPLALMDAVTVPEQRYEFEAACLVRAGWIGVATVDVPVRCIYDVPGGRVSHFRVMRDTGRAALMHAKLMAISMGCIKRRHRALPECRDAPPLAARPGTILTRFLRWLDPRPAWRAVRTDPVGRRRFAAALAVGTFIANLPIYGVQSLVSLGAARLLRLPPLPVVVGSHLSTPPLGPVLIAAAIALGGRIRHGHWPTAADFDPQRHGWMELMRNVLVEWIIGGFIIGMICAILTFVISSVILAGVRRRSITPD